MEHFSHPKHPLKLNEDDIIGINGTCYVCNRTVAGSVTYTCSVNDDIVCRKFYLHKTCAELPELISYHKHNIHPLVLRPVFENKICDVCDSPSLRVTYACESCDFDVCVVCAFEQRELDHEGHQEHTLTLMPREALFKCDACGFKAEDSSYVCTTCDFWIHKTCALSPLTIPDPTYHHHPLDLVYSIPDMHRYFFRFCNICQEVIQRFHWIYYCHKCTYFVHMKCALSCKTILLDEIEADSVKNESDLVELPLPSEESLFQLIIAQCGKLQVEFQGEGENTYTISTSLNDPPIIEEQWSHPHHPLEQLHFSNIRENDEDEDDDDTRTLQCDGCIQPITVSHPSYYACIRCNYFLHSFCATKLPQVLPAGASPFHPEHSLLLEQAYRFYNFVKCGSCSTSTNGFFYGCKTCNMKIDIRCAFLPTRIRHKSHKHNSLVQRPFSNSRCSVSKFLISSGVEYACETCSSFQISIECAFYPSTIKHKYDDHPITLRDPPFFYEGVIYCEVCEEQVDNQYRLYHCGESDHSFHYDCLLWRRSIKLGGTIKLRIDNEMHTLALVIKMSRRKNSPQYICNNCGNSYNWGYYFECDGCGYLACRNCVTKLEDKKQGAPGGGRGVGFQGASRGCGGFRGRRRS